MACIWSGLQTYHALTCLSGCRIRYRQNVKMWGTRSDIAKIVRKKIRFWILQTKPLKSRTCKECEKNVTNLQMKTYIRDNHAEY